MFYFIRYTNKLNFRLQERSRVTNAVKKVISRKCDCTCQLIWFYRHSLSCLPEMCDQLLRDNSVPLLRVVNRRYFGHDFQIYPNTSFLTHDESELEKFGFIDRKKIAEQGQGKLIPIRLIHLISIEMYNSLSLIGITMTDPMENYNRSVSRPHKITPEEDRLLVQLASIPIDLYLDEMKTVPLIVLDI